MASSLADISFDEEDRLIFQVNDPRLRADALRYSLLPKLVVVLREALVRIHEIYGVSALDDSRISQSPNFRERRIGALSYLYAYANVGLGGKVAKEKWRGVVKSDGTQLSFIPFLYKMSLTQWGMSIFFSTNWLKGISSESYRLFLDYVLDNEPMIHRLNYLSRMRPLLVSGEGCDPVSTMRYHYNYMRENDLRYANFYSVLPLPYPIKKNSLESIVRWYASFFPIYDSFLQLAMGRQPRLDELVAKLNWWIKEVFNKEHRTHSKDKTTENVEAPFEQEMVLDKKVAVRPGFRWDVLTRDNWRCVVCGRSGTEGVILHVDHIVPRSKGGKNGLDNYQTLCGECNIGKGNRDATDLRASARA